MSLLIKRRRRQPMLLPSAEAIAGSDDLMTEILIYLPAKSLCRFKCVSKRWYSLISHPTFSILRIPKSVSGIFANTRTSKQELYKYIHLCGKRPWIPPFKSLTFVDGLKDITIRNSCNGLYPCSSGYYGEIPKYYIYNPTTKQFAIIPRPCNFNKQSVSAMNLAFDLSTAPHYKIIVVITTKPPNYTNSWTYRIKIYSSETRAWRFSGKPFTHTRFRYFLGGVFFNGTIHWINTRFRNSLDVDDNPWLRFEVDCGSLRTMPKPTIDSGGCEINVGYFGESRGHLHLVCRIGSSNYYIPFDVLEMESDYSKWVVKYHVNLDACPKRFPENSYRTMYSILRIVREEVEEESYLVVWVSRKAISYNFKDKTIRKLCSFVQDNCMDGGWLDAHPYIETLFSIR